MPFGCGIISDGDTAAGKSRVNLPSGTAYDNSVTDGAKTIERSFRVWYDIPVADILMGCFPSKCFLIANRHRLIGLHLFFEVPFLFSVKEVFKAFVFIGVGLSLGFAQGYIP